MALELPDVQSKLGAQPERGNRVFLFKTAETLNRESYFIPIYKLKAARLEVKKK